MAVVIILIAVVFCLDQLTKIVIPNLIASSPTGYVPVIKNIFRLTLVRNTGTAFGLLKNQTLFFIIISCIAISGLFVLLKKTKGGLLLKTALSLIISGALGNLIDRIRFGYVIDFFDFRIWPVFNVADSAITIGTILLIFRLFLKTKTLSSKL